MLNQETSIRIAVIGVGALGRHHARILSTLPGVQLEAVADPNPEQGQAVARDVGCRWVSDYRELLGTIDAASIVVPTFLHMEVARAAMQRGIHVLVEKPLAANVEEGQVLCRLAAKQPVILQVGHIERFNPAYREVRDWTAAPKYIRTERYSPYPFRSLDIGVVMDLMIHDIDLVLDLTQELPGRVEAFGVSLVGGHEDAAQARLYFPGGAIADLSVNRVCPGVSRTIQVWSRRGCAQADLQQRTVRCFGAGLPLQAGQWPFELARQQQVPVAEMKEQMFGKYISVSAQQASNADALTAELNEFVNVIREQRAPLVSGSDGLRALEVAQSVLSRIAEHRWDGDSLGMRGAHVLTQPQTSAHPGQTKAA